MEVLFDDEIQGSGKTFDAALNNIVEQFRFTFDLLATKHNKAPRMGNLVQKGVKIIYTLEREQPMFHVKFRVQIFGADKKEEE